MRLFDSLRISGEGSVQKTAIAIISTAVILVTAGVVYGWAPLLLILQETGVYSNFCSDETIDPVTQTCERQDLRFALIYTLGVMTISIASFIFGFCVDLFGPRINLVITSILFCAGCLLFAFADSTSFDAYIPGWIGISAGGAGMFYAIILLSDLYERKMMVIGIYSVAFDASAIVFPVYQVIYRLTGLTIEQFFIIYCFVGVFVFISAIIWPRNIPPITLIEVHREEEEEGDELDSEDEEYEDIEEEPVSTLPDTQVYTVKSATQQKRRRKSSVGRTLARSYQDIDPSEEAAFLHDSPKRKRQQHRDLENIVSIKPKVVVVSPLAQLSFRNQLATVEYIFALAYFAFTVLVFNFYLGTIARQLEFLVGLHDEDTLNTYVSIFSFAIPAIFIVSPLIGWMIERLGVIYSLFITQALGVLFSICKMIPILPLQVVTFLIFTLFRGLFYSTMMACIYRFFGFGSFGRLWGLATLLNGVVNYLQYPLFDLALHHESFYYIDLAQVVGTIFFLAYPAMLLFQVRNRMGADYVVL